jgi:hypothetical protein
MNLHNNLRRLNLLVLTSSNYHELNDVSFSNILKERLLSFAYYLHYSLGLSLISLEDPRLTRLKNLINSEEKYLESLGVTVEVYGEVLKYVKPFRKISVNVIVSSCIRPKRS